VNEPQGQPILNGARLPPLVPLRPERHLRGPLGVQPEVGRQGPTRTRSWAALSKPRTCSLSSAARPAVRVTAGAEGAAFELQ